MGSDLPNPAVNEKPPTLKVNYTDLGNGRAIAILAAPCDGEATAYAFFSNVLEGQKPSHAWLTGNVNGVSLGAPSDHDFNSTTLTLGPRTIPTIKGANVTFDSTRSNSSAKQTDFKMWLEFKPT